MSLSFFSPRRWFILFLTALFLLSAIESGFAASKYTHHPRKHDKSDAKKEDASQASKPSLRDNEPGYAAEVNGEMKQAFKEADDLYRNNQLPEAVQKFEAYLSRFPYTALSDAVLYRLADVADSRGETSKSRDYLIRLIGRSPDAEWRERARLLLGRSFYTKSEYQNAYHILSQIQPTYLASWQRVHYYCLLIRLEEKRKVRGPLYAYYMLRLKDAYAENRDEIPGATLQWMVPEPAVNDYVGQWVFTQESPSQVPSEIVQYTGGPALADALLHMGVVFSAASDSRSAYRVLKDFLERYPGHPNTGRAKELLDKSGYQAADEKYGDAGYKAGVMLPLSGPYASFGHAVLRGIRCGSGAEARCGESSDIALVVRDNEGDGALSRAIFSDFAGDDRIYAVVGPMSSKASRELVPLVRDEKHLAVLDMAQGRVGEVLSNFFHIRLSPEVQANRLVERAISQGTKSIGIFYPKNSYGEAMASAFESALIARGGRVPARQSYAVTDESFEGAIRQLKLNVSYFTGSGANGFQALFIPDSNTRIKKMLKPLSDQNMTGIPLIGTNAWSGSPFSADLEILFPGSYFADVFYAGDESSSSQNFVKIFTRAYGRTPTSLEAMAYDLIRAVNQALKQGGGKNRKSLREALGDLKTYKGATTLQGFEGSGEARFQIYLLTQENGQWKRL